MQKIIRATERAKTQAQRKLTAEQACNRKIERKQRIMDQKEINREVRARIMAARTARREDWLMGPLAPRRAVGNAKDTYGTVDIRQVRAPKKAMDERKDWCIREGDRVVVIAPKHRDRGKIGKVKSVRAEADECMVEGLNLVDMVTPSFLRDAINDKRAIQTNEAGIPLSGVRLVYPLLNPETGIRRDVVIKELAKKSVAERSDRPWGRRIEKRYIAGLEPREYIPFPELPPPAEVDHDDDTLRIEIDDLTWTPTLLGPPMPESVIDELRNKYSKFRDRHDDDFIQRKEDGVARHQDWKKKKVEMMRTPLQEFHRKERAEKRLLGWKPLDQETMKNIGQVMALAKGEEAAAAQVVDLSTTSTTTSDSTPPPQPQESKTS